jgi:predicted RNA binding protein YcfA (HicA-like mRNA interferase family)
MPKLPVSQAYDLISALHRAGFETTRQKGSHVRLKHLDGRVVTVPVHVGKDLGRGLLRKILRDAEWTIEDLYTFLKQD